MSWLSKRWDELSAQVNWRDGGKTAATVRASRNQVPPAQTVSNNNRSTLSVGVARPQGNVSVSQPISQPKPTISPISQQSTVKVSQPIATPDINVAGKKIGQAPTATNKPLYDANRADELRKASNPVVDRLKIFDANTATDRLNRIQKGQSELYQDQQKELGNTRPSNNLAGSLFTNTARLANTTKAGVGGLYGLGKIAAGKDTVEGVSKTLNKDLSPTGGLGGVGTLFDDRKDVRNLNTQGLLKKSVGGALGVTGELAPVPATKAVKGTNLLAKSAKVGALSSGANVAADTGNQLVTTGTINPRQTATAAATGFALGAVAPNIVPTTKLVTNAAKPLDESGFIQLGRTPKNIHPEDQAIMSDFIDMQRGAYKPDPKSAYNLELDAARIAERYGLAMPANPVKLANVFDKRLQTEKFGKPSLFRDEAGAVGSNIRKTDPLESLKQEARKYKSAEEFVKSQRQKVYTTDTVDIDPERAAFLKTRGYEVVKNWTSGESIDLDDIATGKIKTNQGYAMTHRPNEDGSRAFDLTESGDIPKDMYDNWYGSRGTEADMESIAALKKIRGNPEAEVTIYRASPSSEFNPGDWVSFSKKYAQQHAESNGGGKMQVHAKKVKAKDVRWAQDDINEFGYYPDGYEATKPEKRISSKAILDDRQQLTDLYSEATQKKRPSLFKDEGGYARLPIGKKDPAPDLHPKQKEFINDYAEMLEGMDSANGVDLVPDGEAYGYGKKRVSSNSPTYSRLYEENGGKPSKQQWFDEARQQIESGKAGFGASDEFKKLPTKRTGRETQAQPQNMVDTAIRDGQGTLQNPLQSPRTLKAPTANQATVESPTLGQQSTIQKSTLDVDDTTNVKINQRGGEKKIPVKPIARPKDLVGNPEQWKDVGSTLKTIDRNLEASTPNKETYRKIRDFLIVPREEAVTRMFDESKIIKDELKGVVKTYGLKNKEVRADVMKYGEKKLKYGELVEKHGKAQADKIVEADKWFRAQYDRLLDETNASLRKFGQPEIPRRDNYYTHFSDDSLWSKVGLKLEQFSQRGDALQDASAMSSRGQKIDPKLLGQSEFTTPNKKFNPFAQRRTGDGTKFDAVEAFERYLVPTLHNKHLTESVVRTRMLTKELQEATADTQNLPKFIRQLQEYGNHLSGKSNRFDRPIIETGWGNVALKGSQYLQKQMGRNTILGSMRSALMQTASLPQSLGQAGYKNTVLGALQELKAIATGGKDEVQELSPFMRRRYAGYDSAIPSKLEKAEKVAGAVFEAIEETSAKSIWRAQHALAQSQGLKGKAAIQEADRLTERIVGGRQIGERAEAFRSVLGNNFLQFQLEVNNAVQQMAQDWKGKPINYVKFFAATYAFNAAIYEPLLGDKPLPDPVDAVHDTIKNAANKNIKGTIGRLPGEVLSNIPGGQMIASALPGKKELFGDTEVGRYGTPFPALGVLQNPEYAIPKSFGLGQVKRSFNGFQDFLEGKSQSAKGEKRFDIAQDPTNAVRAGLLGPYGTKEGNEYIREKQASLTGKETKKQSSTKEDVISAAFNTKEAKEFFALTSAEQKEKAKSDPNAKSLLEQKEAMQTAFNGDDRVSRLTAKGKDKLSEEEKDFEYKQKKADFDKKKAEGKFNKFEEAKAKKELRKEEIGSKYDKELRDLYSMSKEDIYNFISTDPNGKKYADQLLEYDDKLKASGLGGGKFRTSKGAVKFNTAKSTGGKRGRKSKSSSLAGFDYTKSLASSSNTTTKSLRSILNKYMTSGNTTKKR